MYLKDPLLLITNITKWSSSSGFPLMISVVLSHNYVSGHITIKENVPSVLLNISFLSFLSRYLNGHLPYV